MPADSGKRLALDLATWERLVRFQRATTRAMDESLRTTFGHSLEDYDILHQLATSGTRMRMGDLAERLLVANSSCNRLVGRLIEAGYLERTRGEVDRREVLVALTSAGRRLHRRMAAVHTRDIERHFGARLSRPALTGLRRALDELLADDGAAP